MDALEAITEAVALHAGWLEEARLKGNADGTVRRWTRRMQALQEAAKELRALRSTQRPAVGSDPSAEDISDLPADLIAQLSGPKTDPLEEQILDVMQAVGGKVELNRLLIELYRRYGDVHERKALNNKAYRMVQKGLIHQSPDRRGAYSLIAG